VRGLRPSPVRPRQERMYVLGDPFRRLADVRLSTGQSLQRGVSESRDTGNGKADDPVVPMKPHGDKRARLQVVAPYIKNGTVLFPRSGCEELLGQIFNLGVESHDDLNDALVYLLQGLANQGLELPKIHWIEGQRNP
jgi:predicted phage terminase large subunit-like protein